MGDRAPGDEFPTVQFGHDGPTAGTRDPLGQEVDGSSMLTWMLNWDDYDQRLAAWARFKPLFGKVRLAQGGDALAAITVDGIVEDSTRQALLALPDVRSASIVQLRDK